ISAYACRPNVGSEPGVGWNTVRTLARHHALTVFTRADNQPTIEAELRDHPIDNLQFVYFDPPKWATWLPPAQIPHYYLWQIEAYFVAKKLFASQPFDLIHHVTYVRYSTPSFLSLLPLPFIFGPVGGGEQAPGSFWQSFSRRGKLYEILRTLSHRVGEIDPLTRLTARRSALVRATTEETAIRLKQLGASDIQVASALGLSQSEIERLAQQPTPSPLPVRFISIARLLHWKGIYLGLQAFAQLTQVESAPESEYWILGEGPERNRLEALAARLKIAERVKFWGGLPRERTLETIAQCHVLVHPSLHESGGFVCLEAMASGRPVVCLDLGGPAIQVIPEAGLLVPASEPVQTVQALSKAMLTLATDEKLRKTMGEAGRRHIQDNYVWEAKAE
ncbi:MAG: glycosyltransferase, partial [Cyanobacteria bacterium J06576_12]